MKDEVTRNILYPYILQCNNYGHLFKCRSEITIKAKGRARNSHLQTRKMRVEIQFCELKILALEKSCEFNNLTVANTKSYLSLKDLNK